MMVARLQGKASKLSVSVFPFLLPDIPTWLLATVEGQLSTGVRHQISLRLQIKWELTDDEVFESLVVHNHNRARVVA